MQSAPVAAETKKNDEKRGIIINYVTGPVFVKSHLARSEMINMRECNFNYVIIKCNFISIKIDAIAFSVALRLIVGTSDSVSCGKGALIIIGTRI